MARTLVTPALPYANGDIHIGHLVEHVQVNTYVRALRMAGDDVLYVCGADSHGAAIEIKALEHKTTPEAFADAIRAKHEATFARFGIAFDGGYGTTHTDENAKHAGRVYQALKDKGHIKTRLVEQLQDPTDGRFLADRFVKGTCPKCGTVDQYGDSCESCGSTYRATELKDPRSVVTGATPVLAQSEHLFVDLQAYSEQLKAYLQGDVLDPGLRHFLDTWFKDGLKDWDISRDGPYFGFPIPGETNKFFYVWLDAPIGYVALTERALAQRTALHTTSAHPIRGLQQHTGAGAVTWEDYWKEPGTRIEHFIGKDILYFHTLFWPAMLMAAGDTLPAKVRVHGMLTVDGVKMSKSRGTFINADAFADVCEPQALRYYFAAKLTASPDDIDLSFVDFTNRVNADLVNNLVNLISRTLPLLHKNHEGKCGKLQGVDDALVTDVKALGEKVEGLYRALDFAGVVRAVTEMGTRANKLLQDRAPWKLAETDPELARSVLTVALWTGKTCLGLLKPVLPDVVDKLERMLRHSPFTFTNAAGLLDTSAPMGVYEHLFARIELKALQGMIKPTDAAASTTAPPPAKDKGAAKAPDAQSAAKPQKAAKAPPSDEPPGEIGIDAFMAVDLRAARVKDAKAVEGSDKLIAVTLDVGALGERNVFSGLRPHVSPEQLVGRMVVVVANLAPRKMKFGVSAGMILAAGDVPAPLFCDGATPGDRIR